MLVSRNNGPQYAIILIMGSSKREPLVSGNLSLESHSWSLSGTPYFRGGIIVGIKFLATYHIPMFEVLVCV